MITSVSGQQLWVYFPDMAGTPWAINPSIYFQHMWGLLQEALVVMEFNVEEFEDLTTKILYKEFTSTFPPPKVIYKFDFNWSLVWKRLNSSLLDAKPWEGLFMIIHNIVPNRDRLFEKFHRANSPACERPECGAERQDNVHLYCHCVAVRVGWCWLRRRILELMPRDCSRVSDFELIHFFFPQDVFDQEIIWLLGTYVAYVNSEVRGTRGDLKLEKMIGYFRQKCFENRNARRLQLQFQL